LQILREKAFRRKEENKGMERRTYIVFPDRSKEKEKNTKLGKENDGGRLKRKGKKKGEEQQILIFPGGRSKAIPEVARPREPLRTGKPHHPLTRRTKVRPLTSRSPSEPHSPDNAYMPVLCLVDESSAHCGGFLPACGMFILYRVPYRTKVLSTPYDIIYHRCTIIGLGNFLLFSS
jgi:hypothetical protein